MHHRFIFLILCLCATAGCSKSEIPAVGSDVQKPGAETATPLPRVEACSLLTSEEIEAAQGEPVQETKPTQGVDRGLAMADCYFALPTFTNAVSLSVGQRGDAPNARHARDFWKDIFTEATLRGSEKSPPPKKVEGLGDDAYWTGNERMGALHVLHGERYLRISVGGPGDQQAKIDKCRQLIGAALRRL